MFEDKPKIQVLVPASTAQQSTHASLEAVAVQGVVHGCCPNQGQAL